MGLGLNKSMYVEWIYNQHIVGGGVGGGGAEKGVGGSLDSGRCGGVMGGGGVLRRSDEKGFLSK